MPVNGVASKKWGDTGELTTHNLVTCIGVAIRGKDRFTGGSYRVLAHFYGAPSYVAPLVDKLKKECEHLDMTRDRVFIMSILDNDAPVPAGKTWNQADKDNGEAVFHDIREKLEAYLGVCLQTIDKRTPGMDPPASISFTIDGRGT